MVFVVSPKSMWLLGGSHPFFSAGYPGGRLYFGSGFDEGDLLFREGFGIIPEPTPLMLLSLGLGLTVAVATNCRKIKRAKPSR